MADDAEDAYDEDAYELDLDEDVEAPVDEIMEDAVAAVERHRREREGEAEIESDDEGLRERLLRTLADFDNFRKRSEREKEAMRRYAVADVLKDLVGVVDNLERALHSGGSGDDLRQGVEMILKQQVDLLARWGAKRIDAEGQAFDPTVHEAVARTEGDVEEPTVDRELQAGYMLHDRLLRPSMVHVVMPAPRES